MGKSVKPTASWSQNLNHSTLQSLGILGGGLKLHRIFVFRACSCSKLLSFQLTTVGIAVGDNAESQNEMEERNRTVRSLSLSLSLFLSSGTAVFTGGYSAQERSRWVSAIKRRDDTRKHLQCRCNPLSCRSPFIYRVLNIDAIAGKRKQKQVVR